MTSKKLNNMFNKLNNAICGLSAKIEKDMGIEFPTGEVQTVLMHLEHIETDLESDLFLLREEVDKEILTKGMH